MFLMSNLLLFLIWAQSVVYTVSTVNRHTKIIVAVQKKVQEDPLILQQIRDLLSETSKILFDATSGKFYLREVVVVVPSSSHNWTDRPHKVISSRWYSRADIRIGPPNVFYNSAPYTVGSGKCGQQGLFIFLPTDFLLKPNYLDKSNVLFHQWITYSKGSCENKRRGLVTSTYNGYCSENKGIGFYDLTESQPSLTKLKYFETPTFRVVQADKSPRCVLILDTSGSMHRNPMIKLRESAARFIRKLEEGTFIGIVSFGLNAKIELELTKKTRENEGDIIEKMPKEAKGPTAIGDGLQKALKVLGNITEGASFILVSDGEENKPCQGPCVKDIWPAVKRAGVVIDTVALGVSASEKLEAMSRDTGGTSYYIPNAHSSELDKAFFYTVKTIKSDLDLSEVLLSSVKSPVGYNITSFPILIDDSIGHNTMFTFITTRVSNLMADIVGPDLTRYNLTSRQCTVREEENMVLFKFSLAQSGLWTVNLKLNKQPETATVLMIVTSHLRSFQSETVTVESWTEYEVRKKHSNIVIKARVAKGNLPVTGATVDATVTTPNGSTVSIPMEETNQPGLFDGLFLGFNGIGRYSVETHVQNDGRAKIYKGGQSALQILEKFNRTASGGVFKNCYTRTGTMNPPDKVNDFTIIKHWLCGEEQCITFRWTSPSRNAAKTSECQINMSWSHDFIEIQKVVGRSNRVTDEQVKDGSLECVEESRKQTLSVAIDFTRYEEGEMVYFTVRVITDGNRIGDMSNMVKLTVSKEKRLSVSPVTTIKSTLESNVAESVDNETHYVKSTEFPELVSDNRFVHAIQKEVWVLPVICVHILTVIFIIVLSAVYIACKKHKNIRRLMPVNLLKAADNEKSETSNPDKKGISCEVESLQIIMDPRGKSITDSEGVCQINNMTSFYGRKGRPSLTLKAADKNNIFVAPPRIKPQPHESPTTCVEKEDKTTASSMVLLNSSTSKEPTREPEVSNEYEEVIIPLLDSDTVESIKKTLESERQTTRHSGIKLHMHLKTEDTK